MAKKKAKIEDEPLADDPVEEAPEDEELEAQDTDVSAESEEAQPAFWHKLGDDYASLDEEAAAERLQQDLSALRQSQQEAEQLRQERQHYAFQVQQLQQQQEAQRQFQAQQVQQQAAEKKAWKAPEFDPRWLGSVKRDEQGHLIPIHSGVDPTLPQKIETYANWKAEQEQRFWNDPGSFISEQIQDRLSQLVQEQASQAIQSYHRDREIQDWERANSAWFYNPQGQITPAGQMVVNYANQFLGGRTAGAQGLDLARKAVYGELVAQQQQTKNPADTNGKKKLDLLRAGAQRKQTRDGSRERAERKTPVPDLSLEHRFRKAFEENGIGADDFDAVMTPD